MHGDAEQPFWEAKAMTNSDSGGLAKPELAVNRDGGTVADALSGFITHAATDFVGGARLDIATAY